MTPLYLNPQPSSPIPFLEFKGEQLLGKIHDLATSSSSLAYSNLDKNNHAFDESLSVEYSRNPQEIKVENKVLSHEKSNDLGEVFLPSSWPQNMEINSGRCNYDYSSNHNDLNRMEVVTNNDQRYSRKWKPSKVRIMQKMMTTSKNMGEQRLQHNLEQQINISKNNNESNNGIRVCSDCHTTTTPLWRSGPRGPKSLCNACGIRQRKARRAAMAAAAASGFANDGIVASTMPMAAPKPSAQQEDMRTTQRENDNKSHPILPLKKRGKTMDGSRKYNYGGSSHNNNGLISSSSSKDYMKATSQRVFHRDEEEGAFLLMALSCGLACSS